MTASGQLRLPSCCARDGDRRANLERPLRGLECVDALEAAVGELPDGRADDALGVVEQGLHRVGDALATPALA